MGKKKKVFFKSILKLSGEAGKQSSRGALRSDSLGHTPDFQREAQCLDLSRWLPKRKVETNLLQRHFPNKLSKIIFTCLFRVTVAAQLDEHAVEHFTEQTTRVVIPVPGIRGFLYLVCMIYWFIIRRERESFLEKYKSESVWFFVAQWVLNHT